jgi:hypothetical protein
VLRKERQKLVATIHSPGLSEARNLAGFCAFVFFTLTGTSTVG